MSFFNPTFNINLEANLFFEFNKNGYIFKIESQEVVNYNKINGRLCFNGKLEQGDQNYLKLYLINYGDNIIEDIKINYIIVGRKKYEYRLSTIVEQEPTLSTCIIKNGNAYIFAQLPNDYKNQEIELNLKIKTNNKKMKNFNFKLNNL